MVEKIKYEDLETIDELPRYGSNGQFLDEKEVRKASIKIAKYLESKKIAWEGLKIMFKIKRDEVKELLDVDKPIATVDDFIN